MKLVFRSLALVLLVFAFIAPLAATAHCAGDHEAECQTDCACACCSVLAFAGREHASAMAAIRSERACSTEILCMGRLLATDIFRPPISS